jgi:HAMP domain-containing protein
MKLLFKFNVVLITLAALGLAVVALVAHNFLQQNARAQVLQQAELMMESASSVRRYTSDELKPLLMGNPKYKREFLPETVPAYGATTIFAKLRSRFPEYTYREPALNPTNPQDRAVDWESDIIQQFRNHSDQKELIAERQTPSGTTLYLAHPIVNRAPCLECHSAPSAAPASMIRKYGPNNGFGWKPDEIVAAQIVSVPTELPVQIASRAFHSLMFSLTLTFAALIVATNLILMVLIIRPVRRLAHVVNKVSTGQMEGAELPVRGKDEIAELTASFNRLLTSLAKALRMLD